MRLSIATALLMLIPLAAGAQHWNDSGPGRDLLSSTVTDFDNFRQRTQTQAATGVAPLAQPQQRPPIPILDWAPPPANARQAPSQQRRRTTTTTRRSAPRDPAPMAADPAPVAPVRSSTGGNDWERTFSERERELDRLRRILEEDRTRYERSRQPQLQ